MEVCPSRLCLLGFALWTDFHQNLLGVCLLSLEASHSWAFRLSWAFVGLGKFACCLLQFNASHQAVKCNCGTLPSNQSCIIDK